MLVRFLYGAALVLLKGTAASFTLAGVCGIGSVILYGCRRDYQGKIGEAQR